MLQTLNEEQLEALNDALMTVSEIPDVLKDELQEWVVARYGGIIPHGVDIDLHKQVAQVLGATVIREPEGFYYVDERGRRDTIACRDEKSAWWMSQEDWTRRIDDANLLFSGGYLYGLMVDEFTLWYMEQEEMNAAERCRLFLRYSEEIESKDEE